MRIFSKLALAALIMTMACDSDKNLCLHGSGNVNDYPLELDTFDKVSLMGPVNLMITQGATQEVIIKAEPEMYQYLDSKVVNGMFVVGYEENIRCFDTDHGVWVYVTIPDLEEVMIEGASKIRSNGDLDLDKLRIDIAGTGDIALSGVVGEQIVHVSGSIDLGNFNLTTDKTVISIAGAGTLDVTVEEQLDITVSGAATIRYKGNPQIIQDISGTLNLENAN